VKKAASTGEIVGRREGGRRQPARTGLIGAYFAGTPSILISRINVKPQNEKYFAFHEGQITGIDPLTRPTRGAFRDRHEP
jgi:hypothetical protein